MLLWMPMTEDNTKYVGRLRGYRMAVVVQREDQCWEWSLLGGEEVGWGYEDSKLAKQAAEDRLLKVLCIFAEEAVQRLKERPENMVEQLLNDLAYMQEEHKKKPPVEPSKPIDLIDEVK